jgi:hypothetical protein
LEATIMFLSSNFWPLFGGLTGGGAALTAVLSLLAATVHRPRNHRGQPLTLIESVPRHHEVAGQHLLVAGRK